MNFTLLLLKASDELSLQTIAIEKQVKGKSFSSITNISIAVINTVMEIPLPIVMGY